jgi:hypothetical protein
VCFPAAAAAAAAAVHQRRRRLFKPPLSPSPESSPLSSPSPLPPPPPPPLPESSLGPCVTPYAPFARGSINLLTCSSNTGKTHFLTQIVRHRHRFFQDADRIRHLIYINANERDHSIQHPWQSHNDDDDDSADAATNDNNADSSLTITSLTLDHLEELSSVVSPSTILVLDDLLQITDSVRHLLSFSAHHYQLFVVVITQSCISSPLYALLRSAHNLILLLGNTSSTRLAQHLIQSYFLCSDTKAYLKSLLGIAEKQRDVVILKINTVASYRPHSHVLALTRVQGLFSNEAAYCYVYPELGHSDQLMPASPQPCCDPVADMPPLEGQVLPQAFVLLPMGRVKSMPKHDAKNADANFAADNADDDDCVARKRRDWENMAMSLEKEIEQSFLPKRWISAKNLSRQLLLCNDLCIGSDYKTVFLKTRPKKMYSIIDFLNFATRRTSPMERNSEKVLFYKPLVDILLKHHAPESFFVNKELLESPPRRRRSQALYRDFDDKDDDDDDTLPFYGRRRRRRRHPRQSFYDNEPRQRRRPTRRFDDDTF